MEVKETAGLEEFSDPFHPYLNGQNKLYFDQGMDHLKQPGWKKVIKPNDNTTN